MNVHGYKKKLGSIKRLLYREETAKYSCDAKIMRLARARQRCSNKIKMLRKVKKSGV